MPLGIGRPGRSICLWQERPAVPGWPPVSGDLPVRLLRRASWRSGVGGWRAARGGRHDGGGREEQRR
eukprot:4798761-Prymnesium_polylepis.1